jgi:hypothetical protein
VLCVIIVYCVCDNLYTSDTVCVVVCVVRVCLRFLFVDVWIVGVYAAINCFESLLVLILMCLCVCVYCFVLQCVPSVCWRCYCV